MPYKDRNEQRACQTRRYYKVIRKRREDWFKENGPCVLCGSWDDLELDHINRDTKITHKVWHWSDQKREEELRKCQPLCNSCHLGKTARENTYEITPEHGTWQRYKSKRHRCRCLPCTTASSKHEHERRLLIKDSREPAVKEACALLMVTHLDGDCDIPPAPPIKIDGAEQFRQVA